MIYSLRIICFGFLLLALGWLSGCATVSSMPSKPSLSKVPAQGVYHKVQAGETMWRIAKTYGVSIDDIIRNNKLSSAAHIEKAQLIFIPGADRVQTVVVEHDPKNSEFIWPIKGKVISSFGDRKGSLINKGIDIQANEGAVLCASRSGKVVFADYLNGYAYTLILDHADGYYSVYAQNSKLMVKLDDFIEQGNPIAQVGKNGSLAFSHFEIRKRSSADNPSYYLPSQN